MGSVYRRGRKLWLRFKGPDGKWTQVGTDFLVGQERQARVALEKLEKRITAGLGQGNIGGPLTVARFVPTWLAERKLQVEDWKGDEAKLQQHVLPAIGRFRLDQVRPRHLVELMLKLRGELAPKTVYNVYSVVCALFRDALLADLVPASPCVLTRRQLGAKVDSDPEWRSTAIYSRDEIEQLISDPRVPADRRVLYGLEGLAALRHGEAAGLRWRHYDASATPLGMLTVATSYDKGRTKTKMPRFMPVHPALAALLAEWKLTGWEKMFGRAPGPDDLVVPLEPEAKRPGGIRLKNNSRDRLIIDLAALGLRHRRGHDLRRTLISLARSDGALRDILRRGTHQASKEVIEGYTTFEWEVLCREVSKLRIQRRGLARVVALTRAVGAPEGLATVLATASSQPAEITAEEECTSRESNAGGTPRTTSGSAESTSSPPDVPGGCAGGSEPGTSDDDGEPPSRRSNVASQEVRLEAPGGWKAAAKHFSEQILGIDDGLQSGEPDAEVTVQGDDWQELVALAIRVARANGDPRFGGPKGGGR
jgi:integrase